MDKVETIMNFRNPMNKEETRSFLGLVTYLGKFIPDLANTTEPLRRLIKKDITFVWTEEQESAFQQLKNKLAQIPRLSYFNPVLPIRLIIDASPVALGAVLVQFDGEEPRPISFASKSLSEVERRYSQTEKEGLALVWGVERFYYYLYGIEFELVTDHKPQLQAIFSPSSKPPARIERWVLRLQAFKYKVIYKSEKENIADSLSRLCRISTAETFDKEAEHNVLTIIAQSTPRAMTVSEIDKASELDNELVNIRDHIINDTWDTQSNKQYSAF